jgi:glyoxylase-like metal-dependent hydrolase (beta-lactamase superfamily II)
VSDRLPHEPGPKTRDLGNGIIEVFLPLPGKPTIVNIYLVDLGKGEWALVDTGTGREQSRDAFRSALAELGIPESAVRHLLATHHHPDHFGASNALAQDLGTRIHLHPLERETIDWMNEISATAMLDHVRRHGIPVPKDTNDAPKPANVWADTYKPATHTDHELVDGEILDLGRRRFRVVHTPGHTAGHCCFHELESGTLFVGDHLLPKITPHVGVFAGGPKNPLGDFIASQEKIGALEGVTLVGPAHGGVFRDHRHRARQLIAHHEHRMREMRDYLLCRSASAYDVAQHAFRWVFEGDPETQRFNRGAAVMETIAHLNLLKARDKATTEEREGIVYFHAV